MTTNQDIKLIGKRIIQCIIIIILLMFIWSIGKDWLRPRIIKGLGGYTAMEYKESIDTISIERDSIYWKLDSLRTRAVINAGKVITEYKFKYITSSTPIKGKYKDSIDGNNNKIFVKDSILSVAYTVDNDISDTLLSGIVRTIINPKDCKIVEQKLLYKPKFPIFITNTITIEKVKEQTLFDKPKAYIGGGAQVTSDAKAGFNGVYQFPNKIQIQGGVLWNFNKDGIDKSNKVISVSLIKLF